MASNTQRRRQRRNATRERKPLSPNARKELRAGCLRALSEGAGHDIAESHVRAHQRTGKGGTIDIAGYARTTEGATLEALADHLHQPKARVVQALSDDIAVVAAMLSEGATRQDILTRGKRFGWSPEFVALAIRASFGFKPRPSNRQQCSKQRSKQPTPLARSVAHEGERLPAEHVKFCFNLLNI